MRPTSMVEAWQCLRCGSSIDSSMPHPHSAQNRSTNGSSRLRELNRVRNLEKNHVCRKKTLFVKRFKSKFDFCEVNLRTGGGCRGVVVGATAGGVVLPLPVAQWVWR